MNLFNQRKLFKLVLTIYVIYLLRLLTVSIFKKEVSNFFLLDNSNESFFNGSYIPNTKKFLIYTCTKACKSKSCIPNQVCGGLGDRLKGIATAFLWAVLTNRTFILNLNRPCLLQESLQSADISWYRNLSEVKNNIDEGKLSSVKIVMAFNGKLRLFKNGRQQDDSVFQNLLNLEKDTDAILVSTHFFISKIIYTSPAYHSRMNQLGFKVDLAESPNLFRTLYRMLFKLDPRIQKQYDEFIQIAKPTPNTKLICAQIRMSGKGKYFTDGHERVRLEQLKFIWDFIKYSFSITNLPDYKIYVTTDREEIENEAKMYFGSDNVVISKGVITHIDIDQSKSHDDCSRYDKTYLDFEILKNCDMGVVSRSGFSKVGIFNLEKPSNDIYMYDERDSKFKEFHTIVNDDF